MATAQVRSEDSLRLSCIPWRAYLALSDALAERPIRITYDRGEMEIRSPSFMRGVRKTVIRRLIETLTEVLDIGVMGGGSTTFRRVDFERALEPDECYWIQHEAQVRNLEEIDLQVDLPPDLTIEIELSRSSLDRMDIYASLGMPEIWRWDGENDLTVWLLAPRGFYRQSQHSKAFPFLPLDEFAQFLTIRGKSQTQVVKSFRAWVRKRARQGWK